METDRSTSLEGAAQQQQQAMGIVVPSASRDPVGHSVLQAVARRQRRRTSGGGRHSAGPLPCFNDTPLILENSEGNISKIPILFFARICMK